MTYTNEITDAADADIQEAYLRLLGRNPDFAGRWFEGLMRAIEELDTFPRIHSIAADGAVFGREVRRICSPSPPSLRGNGKERGPGGEGL